MFIMRLGQGIFNPIYLYIFILKKNAPMGNFCVRPDKQL